MGKPSCYQQESVYADAHPGKWNISVPGGIESNIWNFLSDQINSSLLELAIMIRKEVLAIPLVAASETGTAQTIRIYMDGVVGLKLHLVAESYKMYI